MMRSTFLLSLFLLSSVSLQQALAGDGEPFYAGDWSLTIGGAVAHGPEFEGAKGRKMLFEPIISLSRQGQTTRFSSRNDSAGFGLFESENVKAGIAGKLITGRRADDADDLKGLHDVEIGVEAGAFAEVYPTDYLRARAEVRQGIRSHDGQVVDLAVDAFADITPDVRISAGPRATWASKGYGKAYYGVNAAESAASGLDPYAPGSGWQSVGAGGAITWKATENVDTSLFAEYRRMVGVAADSSLVRQKGSEDQVTIGVSATYRFDFTLR